LAIAVVDNRFTDLGEIVSLTRWSLFNGGTQTEGEGISEQVAEENILTDDR
jgi:hypothetical protein